MKSIALLGDGLLDNELYSEGAPSIAQYLRDLSPLDWQVALLANEGTSIVMVAQQLTKLPDSTAHIVLSMGGFDALNNLDMLDLPITSTAQGLDLFAERLEWFQDAYATTLDQVLALGIPTTVCTIYNGKLGSKEAGRARLALMMFNGAILRHAVVRGLDVIEMRQLCSEPEDFATPIAASGRGGRKIATAISHALGFGELAARTTTVYSC